MTETEFFSTLEYRLCAELAKARLPEAPGLWCDGFIPESWTSGAQPFVVSGKAWLGGLRGHNSSYQEKWSFALEVHCDATSESSVPWAAILPAEDEHDWYTIDVERRRLHLVLRAHGEPVKRQ